MLRIKDILSMDFAKEFRILAGESGLGNVVWNVGINDYESLEDIPKVFGRGDLLLTSLALYKHESDNISAYLKAFIDAGVSAIAIKTAFEKDIPEDILVYSNQKKIPLISTPNDLFTEDLVVELKQTIKEDEAHSRFEMRMENVLSGEAGSEEEELLLKEIFPDNENEDEKIVYYFKNADSSQDIEVNYRRILYKLEELLPHLRIKGAKYANGLFIFAVRNYLGEDVKTILKQHGFPLERYVAGVYTYTGTPEITLKEILQNSVSAAYVCLCEDEAQINYEDIGVYKYILPFDAKGRLYREYANRFEKIIAYDRENETNFIETILCYVKNQGEIRKTAEEMHQHINTIRYRLRRIHEFLGYDEKNFNEFYVDIVLMSKIYKLISKTGVPFV